MENSSNQPFYWQIARDSLLTPAALTMFQIAYQFDGKEFPLVKDQIDRLYEQARGRGESQRHGGNFATFIRVFEESGWITLTINKKGKQIISVTPTGHQAFILLSKVPDFLKAAPYFLIEIFARYQLNNPSGPTETRNQTIKEETKNSNIFPYWTIWKIMRSCNNTITSNELRRFVFRLQKSEDINATINQIKSFRNDVVNGLSEEELNQKYPLPLEGANSEPKYIMARAGHQIGKHPQLIEKPDPSTYILNNTYLSLIDEVLKNEPVFKEYIDNETWVKEYSKPVEIEALAIPFADLNDQGGTPLNFKNIPDDDPFWKQVIDLLSMGSKNIIFSGAPGTSKTTYALGIGAKLVDNESSRFKNIQFHQSFGYEDFVEGYVPSRQQDGSQFELRNKVFLEACSAAKNDPTKKHVLVIDELNRGDPSRIFGEALTYIERRDEIFQLPSGRKVVVPSNLIVIATMNPFDKSIADLDMAMERRFDKILFPPSSRLLQEIVDFNGMDSALSRKLISFFEFLLTEADNRLGHAYFKDAKDLVSIQKAWEHKVLPFFEKEFRHTPEKLSNIKQQFATIFMANA